MSNQNLTQEEKQLEQALAQEQFVSVDQSENKLLQQAIAHYQQLRRTKPVTIRIPQEDLIKLKLKAHRLGIPYQTLINTLIKQFSSNKISITI